ncbi:MAG: SDR family NAD(P)-dependent oxidoreductase, partial [Jannaschia sp.]
MAEDFNDKVIVVTGGGSGIGAACTSLFGRSGAQVAVIDRDLPGGGVPGAALALSGDVGDAAVVTRQAEEIMARFGRIDGLVTCAGFS